LTTPQGNNESDKKKNSKKNTIFIGSALLVGLMAMTSMSQMIGSANATIEERGEQKQGVNMHVKNFQALRWKEDNV
jgi:hypothetical protein